VITEPQVNNDSPHLATNDATCISTRAIQTSMFLDDGDKVVLAGIYTSLESANAAGVPFPSELSVAGGMFRQRE